jgi:hypothetical protein
LDAIFLDLLQEVLMKASTQRMPGWMFILGWMGLSIFSLLLAWWATWAILKGIQDVVGGTIQVAGQTHITEDYLAFYVLIPLVGLFSGLLQFLLLRLFISRPGGWILATFLGWMVLFAILGILSILNPTGWAVVTVPFLFSIAGGVVGLAQWRVLKSQVRLAGWWILISGLAWGLTGLIIGTTISEAYDFWVLLLLPALATGLGLWLLLVRLPRRNEPIVV